MTVHKIVVSAFLVGITALALFYVKNAEGKRQCPLGIGPIRLGDKSITVYKKIIESDFIICDRDWHNMPYVEWSRKEAHNYRADIRIFDETFRTSFKFNKQDRLYQIKLSSIDSLDSIDLTKIVVKAYSEKYGKPNYINLKARPNKRNPCLYIAKWHCRNVKTDIYICYGRDDYFANLFITISDVDELEKIKKEEAKKRRKEEKQRLKVIRKSKELI